MSYIKKEYQRLLDMSDRKFIIPNSFRRFTQEKEWSHNLIIKSKGGKCTCTNCGYGFISKVKVNKEIKCPNCRQELHIKTDRLQNFEFKDNLQLLDKVENIFVLRTFELYSSYNNCKVKHIITEFMRTIIKDDEVKDFVTNQVHNHMGYMYIAHYQKFTHWRGRNYRWSYRDVLGMVSPYNLKNLLKDSMLKYSKLDVFVSKMRYIDFIEHFTKKAYYPSFELLVKAKLYNLATNADKFYQGKTFQEIIGVPKTYYSFMKKHDITYEELSVLRLIKKEDIKLIKALTYFHNLKELSKYVDLEKAYNKVLKIKCNSEHEYLDYLRACNQLGYDMKDNKILFPIDLEKEHDKVQDLLVLVENEANDRLIKERLDMLNKYIYKNKKYIIFPATSVESLIEESRQLGHCVRNYCSKYALAECDIYFMRDVENQTKPLVTIEVREGKVIQSRIKKNDDPTPEQIKFINKWELRLSAV